MADQYIDYFEVSEYGEHFVAEAGVLRGLSSLVDIDALRAKVQTAVEDVQGELQKAGMTRSDLRGGRETARTATARLQGLLDRFFHYLKAQPDSVEVDIEAFFPGGSLGRLAGLKPADVKARAEQVLHGFAASTNAGVSGLGKWKIELSAARGALDAAIRAKGNAKSHAMARTVGLVEARERFLAVYNGVAKSLVHGMLVELGRGNDLPRFFLDLQVNERRASLPTKAA